MKCTRCGGLAAVKLPSHHAAFCPVCFERYYKRQVETAVRRYGMIQPGEKVLVAVSGGKDSLGLLRVLSVLGHDVEGLHVHLGIPKASDAVCEKTEAFCRKNGFPLHILRLAEVGLAIPRVKAAVKRPICAACGKIKRHYFNKFAYENGYTALATGHNLDDEVARLFANVLRWDGTYLGGQGPTLPADGKFVRKIKPLFRLSEFESATYCFLTGIDHWHAACPYSGGASFAAHKKTARRTGTPQPRPENVLLRGLPGARTTVFHGRDPGRQRHPRPLPGMRLPVIHDGLRRLPPPSPGGQRREDASGGRGDDPPGPLRREIKGEALSCWSAFML